MKESGFLDLLSDRTIKSIPDYFIGVEVGLDSNGRKNRSGTSMENLAEFFIKDICQRNGYEYIAQATADKIYKQWGKKITVNKSSKRIDFAINTPHKLYLIETNFYGGVIPLGREILTGIFSAAGIGKRRLFVLRDQK